MTTRRVTAWLLMLALAAPTAAACAGAGSSSPAEQASAAAPQAGKVSTTQVLDALDALGVEHKEPVKADPGMTGASRRFNLEVGDETLVILEFRDKDDVETWQELGDSLAATYVIAGLTGISLGREQDKLASQLADALDGTAYNASPGAPIPSITAMP